MTVTSFFFKCHIKQVVLLLQMLVLWLRAHIWSHMVHPLSRREDAAVTYRAPGEAQCRFRLIPAQQQSLALRQERRCWEVVEKYNDQDGYEEFLRWTGEQDQRPGCPKEWVRSALWLSHYLDFTTASENGCIFKSLSLKRVMTNGPWFTYKWQRSGLFQTSPLLSTERQIVQQKASLKHQVDHLHWFLLIISLS